MSTEKQLTKSYFIQVANMGLNVKEMAEKLTEHLEIKITPTNVRAYAKIFDINLRSKPRKVVVLVDDTNDVPEIQAEITETFNANFLDEGYSNMDNKVVIK